MLEAYGVPSGLRRPLWGAILGVAYRLATGKPMGSHDFSGGAGMTAQETASGIGQHLQLAGRSGPLSATTPLP
jgi:hypothetical protein